jgi:hypothetical protein
MKTRTSAAAIASLFIIAAFSSCEVIGLQDTRSPIIDEEAMRVMVRVQLDWSVAELEQETDDNRIMASVWFFPVDGGKPIALDTDEALDSIDLPIGDYHILAFNELLTTGNTSGSVLRNIGFRNTEHYETFEAFCRTPVTLSSLGDFATRASGDTPVSPPEVLAVAHYRDEDGSEVFRVTTTMLDEGIRPTLTFAPRRITDLLHLTVHVENLISVTSEEGANLASVSGLASSIRLASGQPGNTPVTHFFPIHHKKFKEGSTTDGTIEGSCYFFGLAGEVNRELNIYFTLRDREKYPPIPKDITNHFSRDEQTLQVVLNIEVGGGKLGEDDIISLPDTHAPEGEGSAFDADVEDWGENIVLPVDI